MFVRTTSSNANERTSNIDTKNITPSKPLKKIKYPAKQNISPPKPNQILQSEITYIHQNINGDLNNLFMSSASKSNLNKVQITNASRTKSTSIANTALNLTNGKHSISHVCLVFLLTTLMFSGQCSSEEITEESRAKFRRERADAAENWAPLIFMHPEERYFPSSVHTFLKEVVPRNIPESERPPEPSVHVPMSRSLDTLSLPAGVEGESIYLVAPIDSKCRNCPLPGFLHGTKPSIKYYPPVYATITSCLPTQKEYRDARHLKPQRRNRRKKRFKFGRRRRFSLRGLIKRQPRHIFARKNNQDSHKSSNQDRGVTSPNNIRNTRPNSLLTSKEYYKELMTKSTISKPSSTLLPPKSWLRRSSTFGISNDFETTKVVQIRPTNFTPLDASSINNEESEIIIIQDELPLGLNYTDNHTINSSYVPLVGHGTELNPSSNQIITPTQNVPPKQHKTISNNLPQQVIKDIHGHRYTITYWMFYPFSQGKKVCTSRFWFLGRVFKPRLRNKCYGEAITLNSHVGDWEHTSIYFENNVPQTMYVSTHTYGAYYRYEPRENLFLYIGKDTRDGLPLNPKYPPIIKLDGTHPVLYSALGSHGLWGNSGVQKYEHLIPLSDITGPGVAWKTWKNIDIIDYKDPDLDRPDRQWMHFRGRWGNPASGCHKALFGSCDLSQGPTGISLKRENFPCHDPQHPSFYPKD